MQRHRTFAVLALLAALAGIWPAAAEACSGCCCGHGPEPTCAPAPAETPDCCSPSDDPVDPPAAIQAPSQSEALSPSALVSAVPTAVVTPAEGMRVDRARASPGAVGLFTLHSALLI